MAFIEQPARKIPVRGSFDVVVVGGGIAGVSAAVAAARSGAKVALLEKEIALGGLATIGIVTVYLPLCNGLGTKVTGGMAEELLKCSVRDGSVEIPEVWSARHSVEERNGHRYQLTFNPASFIMEMDRLVEKSGVKLFFDTRFCDVVKTGDRISAVIVENKDGVGAIKCKAVVDASGDADVCARAEEKTVTLKGNVACGWFYSDGKSGTHLHKFTQPFTKEGIAAPKGVKCGNYSGVKADDVTRQVLDSRMLMSAELKKYKKATKEPDRYPLMVPTFPCFRMTRRLDTAARLEERDSHKYSPDNIGVISHWYRKGPIYFVDYQAIAAQKTANLFAAGRCCSAGKTGWDLLRVIPACAVTGEAAGIAAAMLRKNKSATAATLDVSKLQAELKKRKCLLGEKMSRLPLGDQSYQPINEIH